MKTNIKEISYGVVEMTLDLDGADLAKYVDRAETTVGERVQVDGFRKGKAPKEILRKHVGESDILQLALQEALTESMSLAIKENKLDVADTSDLKIIDNTASRLHYSVRLSVYPQIQLPDLNVIKIPKREIKIEDKEIQDALDVIRNWRSTFTAKEDAAMQGDRVEVDFSVTADGKPLQDGESKNHPLVIGGKSFIPGFEEALIGMKAGESKEFSLTTPNDYYRQDLAGKKLDFKVKTNLVQSVNLPELNDEFAKSLGRFNSVDQLRLNVQEGISEEKKIKEKQRLHLEILEKIIQEANIKAPEFLIQNQLDSMLAEFDAQLHSKGLELGMYLAQIGKKQDDLRKDWLKDADKQAKIVLVIRAIAKDKEITVGPKEIDEAVNSMVQSVLARGQAEPDQIDMSAIRRRMADRMLNEKTLDFIEGICAI